MIQASKVRLKKEPSWTLAIARWFK